MHTRYLNCGCRRLRDKYEAEISELERNEQLITEKYNKTKVCLHNKLHVSVIGYYCKLMVFWER